MSVSEAKFKINAKEGLVELEGSFAFVDKHLEKFEELFKSAIKDIISRGVEGQVARQSARSLSFRAETKLPSTQSNNGKQTSSRHSLSLPPIPVDLKANEDKIGLREFYAQKKPNNHYEKTAVFAYYLSKFNKQAEIRYGEILSCYEEVDDKKPSVSDIVKNSVRYKGWLETGSDRFSTRLTISGENYVKFDLPKEKGTRVVKHSVGSHLPLHQ